MKTLLAMLALALAVGCTTDGGGGGTKAQDPLRPDGTVPPTPAFETNVTPWVWTNAGGAE